MYPSMKLSPYPEHNAYIPRAASLGNEDDGKYIVTTKIMVLALAVLFAVVFFVVCLHIYAKWVWSTTPARLHFSFWRRRRSRDEIVQLDADVLDINIVMGLGKAAVDALPKFRYEEHSEHQYLECVICLGKFEEGEMGRALPQCGHCFHLECIDMWLFSHSTCPLCRAVLDTDVEVDSIAEVFHLEPLEPATEADPDDQGDKRADAIPANVLFWGNHTHGPPSLELARISVNNNSSSPSQVVIEVEQVPDSLPRGGSLHRLLGRGARAVEDGGNMVVTPFRPSPSPSSTSSSSRVSSGVSGHGCVFSAEEP